jgi:hypothetical protein
MKRIMQLVSCSWNGWIFALKCGGGEREGDGREERRTEAQTLCAEEAV